PELVRPGRRRAGRRGLVVGRRRRPGPHLPPRGDRADPHQPPRARPPAAQEGRGEGQGEGPAEGQDGRPSPRPAPPGARPGLARDSGRGVLYSRDSDAGNPNARPLNGSGDEARDAKPAHVGVRPYDVALARNGPRLYVSDWAARAVLAVDPADLRVVAKIPV